MTRSPANILIVRDNRSTADRLSRLLSEAGHSIDTQSPRAAMRKITQLRYDLVIIDWSGLELCRSLRLAGSSTPVLIVTQRCTIGDKLEAFDGGVDDFLTVPYYSEELVARIGALLRRHDIVRAGALTLHLREHAAFWGGRRLELTVREFKLLHMLVRNAGRPLSRDQILAGIAEIRSVARSNVIDVHIRNLRLKLGPGAVHLRSVRGSGYCYDLSSNEPRETTTRRSARVQQGPTIIRAARNATSRAASPTMADARGSGTGGARAAAGAR